MRWKKVSNFEVAIFFSIAYTLGAFLDIIGPVHMNASGQMSSPRYLLAYVFIYWIIAMLVTWGIYFYYRRKATITSFAVSILVGIIFILVGIFLWGMKG